MDALTHGTVRDSMSWRLLAAYMARRVKLSRSESTVCVAFKSEIEAQEFQKHLTSASPRKDSER